MAKYGSNVLTIQLTDAGDALQDISNHVRTFNGIELEGLSEEGHGFGESYIKNLLTGMLKIKDIVLEGLFDDDANTPVKLWAQNANRRLKVTWGGTNSTTLPVIMVELDRSPKLGQLTMYKLMLRHGGTAAALNPVET